MLKKQDLKLLLILGLLSLSTTSFSQSFPVYDEEANAGSAFTKSDNPHSWIYTATNNWMSYLPNSTKLRDVSIPGTHDSGARYLGLAYEAQSWTITEQLNAGIRYLDIRCRPTGTSFAIHHGNGFQKQMFGDIMNEVVSFLNAHPNETIVMRMKANEHTPESGSESASQIWTRYRTRYSSHLYQGHNTNPTLGDVRGKVFVLLNGCSGCTYNGMSYNESGHFETQDYYKVYWFAHNQTKGSDWATLPSKKDKIKEYINTAKNSSKWVLNHLSGAVGMTPPDVARATNNMTYEYLAEKSGKRKLGILIMDFPGERLIYRIIKSNFDVGSFSEYRVEIDNCHSDLDNGGTGGTITVEFWAGSQKMGTKYMNGVSENCLSSDVAFVFRANKNITHINVRTNSSDAFYIDEIRLYKDGTLKAHHGRDNGSGWCLSTDANDANGAWKGRVAGNTCKSSWKFEYKNPPPSAPTVDYKVEIDNCHSDLDNGGTGGTITVEFWAGSQRVNSSSKNGVSENCWSSDASFSIRTNKNITHIFVKTNSGDAFYIDEIRLYKAGSLKQHHGRDNGSGWCVSTDANDANGAWKGRIAGNTCRSSVRFNY